MVRITVILFGIFLLLCTILLSILRTTQDSTLSWIAFSVSERNDKNIYIVSPDGRFERKLTNDSGIYIPLYWDWPWLIIRSPNSNEFFRVNNFTYVLEKLDLGDTRYLDGWLSPDLQWRAISSAFAGENSTSVSSSQDRQTITQYYLSVTKVGEPSEKIPLAAIAGQIEQLSWSSDGKFIAFVDQLQGVPKVFLAEMNYDFSEEDFDLSKIPDAIQLTDIGGIHSNPQWSPNAEWIAFSSNSAGQYDIYYSHSDGTDLRRLTQDQGTSSSVNWSPDGAWLVFNSIQSDNIRKLFSISSNGTDLIQLSSKNVANYPAVWSPTYELKFSIEISFGVVGILSVFAFFVWSQKRR